MIIKKKFLLVFVLLISVGVVISSMLSLSLIKTNYEKNIKDSLLENGQLVASYLQTKDDLDSMESWLKIYSRQTNTRVTLIDINGEVVLDSQVDKNTLGNHQDRPEIVEALKGNVGVQKRFSEANQEKLYYVAFPIKDDKVKVIRMAMPLNNLTHYLDNMVLNIFVASIIGILFATLLGLRFLNMFTKPLADLTQATDKIAKGDFGEQVKVHSDDEIGKLAMSFNSMSLELYQSIHEIKESNSTNKAILKSMVNGVIAVDESTNIMFINKSAQKMFKLVEKDLIGKNVIEALKNHPLGSLFPKSFDVYSGIKGEIELEEPYRVYKVFSSMIKDLERDNHYVGQLMSFIDITQMRQLENMRKDFVANVSHELKTPLTSIQGFIETLKEGASEDKALRDRFINIIDIEAGRLKKLIDDILVLSDIEKNFVDHQDELIDFETLIFEVSSMLNQIALKKNIELTYSISENLPDIRTSKVWFKQLLINLLDNGIKYTPENGKVSLSMHETSEGMTITVKDNGIGISDEHIDRLFERFYRVDKARSKKEGGTGLGLAIVKHIVLALHGDIKVVSQPDKGTTFYIDLPKS